MNESVKACEACDALKAEVVDLTCQLSDQDSATELHDLAMTSVQAENADLLARLEVLQAAVEPDAQGYPVLVLDDETAKAIFSPITDSWVFDK